MTPTIPKPMTRTTFLAKLEQAIATDSAYRLHFLANDAIRLCSYVPHRSMCIITYVAWRHTLGRYDIAEYAAAGLALGLPEPLSRQLVRAADNEGAPVLRQQILTICTRNRRAPEPETAPCGLFAQTQEPLV